VLISPRYPYISHLILNAALLPVIAVDYLRAIKDLLAEFAQTVTQPNFLIQAQGLESPDGLGMVFQSNVLGHFCLVGSGAYFSILHSNHLLVVPRTGGNASPKPYSR